VELEVKVYSWKAEPIFCAVAEEVSHTMKVDMTSDEWERWRQFKWLALGEQPSAEASTSPAIASSANFGGNNSNTLKHKSIDTI
jgi:hypothetical protein